MLFVALPVAVVTCDLTGFYLLCSPTLHDHLASHDAEEATSLATTYNLLVECITLTQFLVTSLQVEEELSFFYYYLFCVS